MRLILLALIIVPYFLKAQKVDTFSLTYAYGDTTRYTTGLVKTPTVKQMWGYVITTTPYKFLDNKKVPLNKNYKVFSLGYTPYNTSSGGVNYQPQIDALNASVIALTKVVADQKKSIDALALANKKQSDSIGFIWALTEAMQETDNEQSGQISDFKDYINVNNLRMLQVSDSSVNLYKRSDATNTAVGETYALALRNRGLINDGKVADSLIWVQLNKFLTVNFSTAFKQTVSADGKTVLIDLADTVWAIIRKIL